MSAQSKSSHPQAQVRTKVVAVDGTVLSPALPKSIRRMLATGVAVMRTDDAGVRFAQLRRKVGDVVPHG